jgi:uncharacterized protein (DUF1800 family)
MHRVTILKQVGKAAAVGVLCGLMVVPPGVLGQQVSGTGLPVERHVKALTEQERVLQALNRFTFGPRPGEVAAVERMGLERWFEMQLHPERIDDSGMVAAMGEYPAMGLAAAELKERFPSGQMIWQMGRVGGSVPGDPVERAIYADASYADAERLRAVRAQDGVVGMKAGGGTVGDGGYGVGATSHPSARARTDGAPEGTGAGTHPAAQGTRVEDGALAGGGTPEVLGVGMSPAVVEGVLGLSAEERLGRLVGMSPDEMFRFREAVKGKDRLRLVAGMTAAQREAVVAMVESPERVVSTEDQEMRLMRDIDSKRQLQAVMAEFWLNHFNVYLHKNEEEPYLLPEYVQGAILPHALGKFEDLLVATAKSPAMLMYLDNWESMGPNSVAGGNVAAVQKARPNGKIAQKVPKGMNENYGRELMELHTLGVGGGYTQKDVIEVAKCFTGWTIDRPYAGGGKGVRMDGGTPGEFVFDARRHEPGSKVVLGHVIAEGGMNEGLEVLHILAASPATAHFLSHELAVRFVSDTPPPVLVNRMAGTYMKTGGDIGAVLETMFRSKEFWAPGVYRAKVKTPLEFLASAVRASGATVTNAMPLVQAMDRLGMPVWGMQTPNGYGWTAGDWVSSNGLLGRMNFALVLSGNKVNGTVTDWGAVLGGPAVASGGTEGALERELLGETASERTRAAVMAEVGSSGGVEREAGLLMGSPEFQRR